jgi:hypothetical protein
MAINVFIDEKGLENAMLIEPEPLLAIHRC